MADEILLLEQKINYVLRQAFPDFKECFAETGIVRYKNKKTGKGGPIKSRSVSNVIASKTELIRSVRGRYGGIKVNDQGLKFLGFSPTEMADYREKCRKETLALRKQEKAARAEKKAVKLEKKKAKDYIKYLEGLGYVIGQEVTA